MAASRPGIRKVEDKSRKENEWHCNNKRHIEKKKDSVRVNGKGLPRDK